MAPRRGWPRSRGSPSCSAIAKSDPTLVAIVVAWLSGELPQRQIGVGWAALRSVPPAAAQPSLTVIGVDATFSAIGAVSGKGSQARRADLVAGLFASATEVEQTFLRRLLTGELRQGALAGVMADAVAAAAQIPAAAVRRAAMLGGALPAVAAAGLTGGTAALDAFTLRVGRPVGPMLAQTAAGVAEALEKLGGTAVFEAKLDGARVQIHRAGDQVTVYTRSLDDVTARLPEVVEATLALPVRELIADGEAIALRPDGRPQPFQVTGSRFGRSVDVAAARAAQPLSVFFFDILHRDGIDLLDAPTSERTAALDDIVPAQNRVDRLITSDPVAAGDFLDATLAAGTRGRDGQVADRALRGGPPRGGLAQGQTGAHPGPGGAGRRVGFGTAPGKAVQHSSGRPRPGHRRLCDVGQDLQGHDRRDAGLADRAFSGAGRRADRRLRRAACGRSRSSRWRSTGSRTPRVTPAVWRCGSPGYCATATTNDPTRPTPSTPCVPLPTGVKAASGPNFA